MKPRKKQYTIRNVPEPVDSVLRERAKRLRKSLNEVALEALRTGAGVAARARHTDLDFFVGSWVHDKAVDEALADQRRVDESLWK